jgi:hypothetical protein
LTSLILRNIITYFLQGMRSLGLNPPQGLANDMVSEAKAADGEYGKGTCDFGLFCKLVERARENHKAMAANVAHDLDALKDGIHHFYGGVGGNIDVVIVDGRV